MTIIFLEPRIEFMQWIYQINFSFNWELINFFQKIFRGQLFCNNDVLIQVRSFQFWQPCWKGLHFGGCQPFSCKMADKDNFLDFIFETIFLWFLTTFLGKLKIFSKVQTVQFNIWIPRWVISNLIEFTVLFEELIDVCNHIAMMAHTSIPSKKQFNFVTKNICDCNLITNNKKTKEKFV